MKKIKQERIFLNLRNEFLSVTGDFVSFVSGCIFGTKTSKVELSSRIIVKIASSKMGLFAIFFCLGIKEYSSV